jgi:hypothetical protein
MAKMIARKCIATDAMSAYAATRLATSHLYFSYSPSNSRRSQSIAGGGSITAAMVHDRNSAE